MVEYPFFLVTSRITPLRTQAIALRPVVEGLASLREYAERRLADFIFPFKSSTEDAATLLKYANSAQAVSILRSTRLSQVRVAPTVLGTDDDEVWHLWDFDADPRLVAASPGWPLILPNNPVTIRRRDAPPSLFEVEVTAIVGQWRWSGGDRE